MVILNRINFFIIALFLVVSIQSQARVVSNIDVERVGAQESGRKDENERAACKVYRPTQEQLITYFNLATESQESGNLLHEYYSPCIATGKVKFKDGASGVWTVQSSGLGLAILDNGESLVFFHKDNQWTDPYACTYGLGNDPIC
ncbi:hypothetical protein [Erwinia rhapontici]|uniref:hypothetical protein n=1 Tax=Erwinia rhapontici TaxID=55212 RepID=UPI003B9EA0EC